MQVQPGSLLRVVPNGVLVKHEKKQAEAKAALEKAGNGDIDQLAGHVRTRWEQMRRHRDTVGSGWTDRLLSAMRAFNGSYEPDKLAEIRKFGGSEIYARVVAMKCRGASSLLRDVYLSTDRPWGLEPPDDPELPPDIINSITQLLQGEAASLSQGGQPPSVDQIRDRTIQLVEAAREAAKKKAKTRALVAEDKIDEMLKQGGFYKALAEFLVDLPLFPFACIKGPVVRIVPTVKWVDGKATIENKPRMFWQRVSPFDLWWTPGVNDIEDAEVVERTSLTRADLNDLLDLPGYNTANVRAVLQEYGRGGLTDTPVSSDSERAVQENRENPQQNNSNLIQCLEYTGNIQGRMLLDYGVDPKQCPDPMRDYFVQVWVVGRYIIKVQMSPSPRKRHAYFITSFEKVPGTPVGNGLPDILNDIQEASNATLRALINNISIASGPQVTVNDDRLAHDEDGEELYPWKRWHVTSDPMGGGNTAVKPIEFFQPDSRAQELSATYTWLVNMADELSAIPKYLSGSGATGGAGRTASGLAMLMGNASKILQTVAANIDRDVFDPLLTMLHDMLMLTDTSGLLSGEETIRVLGVAVAVQKETLRARQLEFLQTTANPLDMQIIGPKGRAAVLRAVSNTLGLPGNDIVPSEDELIQQQKQAAQAAQNAGQPGHGGMGDQAGATQGGQGPVGGNATGDQGPRTNTVGPNKINGGVG